MIKINLLPRYIIERRRVKALAALLVFVLVVEVLAFAAYLWAPMPFSLTRQWQLAEERRKNAEQDRLECEQIEQDSEEITNRFAGKASFVNFVAEADALPGKWVEYFKRIRKYIPAEVVLNGLPLPSGTNLNLSGSTSGLMAAARWYLNMLRCEMIQRDPNLVSFSTDTSTARGQVVTGGNPKMQQSVSISVALRPEYLDIINLVPAPPSGAAAGVARRGGGARMGASGTARGGRGAARGARRGGRARGGRRGRRRG